MSFPKAALAELLASLDHKNDALWTDDGAPLVNEVQRLANDKTITRAQINDALPGLIRKTKDSVAEDVQSGDEGDETGGSPVEAKQTRIAPAVDLDEPLDDPEEEGERLRAIAHKRVLDAEVNLTEAKTREAEAHRAVVQAEQRHDRALQIYSSKYPPISVEENIKQHLRRQQEILRERVTGSRFEPNQALNPVDRLMMDRKRDNGRKGKPQAPFIPRQAAIHY